MFRIGNKPLEYLVGWEVPFPGFEVAVLLRNPAVLQQVVLLSPLSYVVQIVGAGASVRPSELRN